MTNFLMSVASGLLPGIVLGVLAVRAQLRPWGLALALLGVVVPMALFAPTGLLRTHPDTATLRQLETPGIHTVLAGKAVTTVFVWPRAVNDSLYLVGLRPVRAITLADADSTWTVYLSGAPSNPKATR